MKSVFVLSIIIFGFPLVSNAQSNKKVQEMSFDGTDVDGKIRNPDGSFLIQKRGIDFVPLYKVKDNFDKSIKESVEFLR